MKLAETVNNNNAYSSAKIPSENSWLSMTNSSEHKEFEHKRFNFVSKAYLQPKSDKMVINHFFAQTKRPKTLQNGRPIIRNQQESGSIEMNGDIETIQG